MKARTTLTADSAYGCFQATLVRDTTRRQYARHRRMAWLRTDITSQLAQGILSDQTFQLRTHSESLLWQHNSRLVVEGIGQTGTKAKVSHDHQPCLAR